MPFAARLAAVVAIASLFAPPAAAASFGPSQPLFVRTGFVRTVGMEPVVSDYYPTIAIPTSEAEVELGFFSYRACNKAPGSG